MTANEKKELQIAAYKVRMGVIQSTHAAKAGHPGGSLSAADLFAYLYCRQLNVDPPIPGSRTGIGSSSPRATAPRGSIPPWRCGASSPGRT